jgi:hypothetical protein
MQAVVFLATGRAAIKVGTQTRDGSVGVFACKLEFDVAIELLETGIASDFRLRRPEEPSYRLLQVGPLNHLSSSQSSSSRPRSSRCLRSLRRASCNVL